MDHPTPTKSFNAPFSLVCILTAGLSGGLMAACYWPLEWHWAAWVALVPWLLILPRLSASQAWLYGAVVGLVFYRIGLGWLFEVRRTREEGPGVLLGNIHRTTGHTIFVRGGFIFGRLIGWAFLALVLVLTASEWINRIRRRFAGPHEGGRASLV